MLYGSDERFSGSECLAFEARLTNKGAAPARINIEQPVLKRNRLLNSPTISPPTKKSSSTRSWHRRRKSWRTSPRTSSRRQSPQCARGVLVLGLHLPRRDLRVAAVSQAFFSGRGFHLHAGLDERLNRSGQLRRLFAYHQRNIFKFAKHQVPVPRVVGVYVGIGQSPERLAAALGCTTA